MGRKALRDETTHPRTENDAPLVSRETTPAGRFGTALAAPWARMAKRQFTDSVGVAWERIPRRTPSGRGFGFCSNRFDHMSRAECEGLCDAVDADLAGPRG